jgi:NhaA family Na+:H+ antiporter
MRFGNLFQDFFNSEKSGGLVLLGCTILSLFIANSAWGESYLHFWHQHLNGSFSNIHLDYSIEHWINDGLMTIFFLLVGLEIERELYTGELSNPKNAVLPVMAAVGGILFPALIHFLFNQGTETQHGFGIPMATDIAFALGMLSLLGKRVPHSLKIFLTALAIIDDLCAILVIAFFYTSSISGVYLGAALGIFGMLLVFNRLKVRHLFLYLMPGVAMWYCMLQSGVHATISGVLLAFAIPFGKHDERNVSYHLQHALHKPVAFVILPLFALANTAIVLNEGWQQNLAHRNSFGIILGLVVGKPLGITLLSWLMVRLGWGRLPEGTSVKYLLGAGMLGGIGFTMSIFIANLAFADADLIQSSKVAVLAGSLAATLLGLGFLYGVLKKPGMRIKP